jgi:ubiquitin thioesterase protein OTUB1
MQDSDSIKYQDCLRRDIIERYPLISEELPIDDERAVSHLSWDSATRNKVDHLKEVVKSMRIVRPDGNCFYRAFATRLIELAHVNPDLKQKLLASFAHVPESMEEFRDVFFDVLNDNQDPVYLDSSTDLYVIAFMRLLTSQQLRENSDDYIPYLTSPFTSIDDFCRKEVEPMHRESDQIEITALAHKLRVSVNVYYIDRSSEQFANVIKIGPTPSSEVISLVYKPGHYDILYV